MAVNTGLDDEISYKQGLINGFGQTQAPRFNFADPNRLSLLRETGTLNPDAPRKTSASAAGTAGKFTLLNVDKNPAISNLIDEYIATLNSAGNDNGAYQGRLNSLLGELDRNRTDASLFKTERDATVADIMRSGRGPTTITPLIKSDALASRLGAQYGRFDSDSAANRGRLSAFESDLGRRGGAIDQFNAEEGRQIGRVYGEGEGSLSGQLAGINNRFKAALRNLTRRDLGRAVGQAKIGGFNGLGDSYLNAQLADAAGNILTKAAVQSAERDRNDALAVLDAQGRFAGLREGAESRAIQRGLLPLETQQRLAANEQALLGNIGAAEQANTYYDVETPEREQARAIARLGGLGEAQRQYLLNAPENVLARRLGILSGANALGQEISPLAEQRRALGNLGQLQQAYLGNRFLGLDKLYDPNEEGLLPRRRTLLPQRYSPLGRDDGDYGDPQTPSSAPATPRFAPRYQETPEERAQAVARIIQNRQLSENRRRPLLSEDDYIKDLPNFPEPMRSEDDYFNNVLTTEVPRQDFSQSDFSQSDYSNAMSNYFRNSLNPFQ